MTTRKLTSCAMRGTLLAGCALGLVATPVLAQDAADDSTDGDVIIVTGTRSDGVSPTESLSPVSVVGGQELTEQAAPSLTDALTNIAPSINTQRFPIADGTAFVRPVSLRNLAPRTLRDGQPGRTGG